MFKASIPEITDEELLKRYAKIKPVVTSEGKKYYLREFSLEELRNHSYLWDCSNDIRDEVPEGTLKEHKEYDFACLHTYGYHGLFKPSVAEVLSQIKDPECDFCKAFEIIEEPESAEDFYKDKLTSILFNNGFHVSTVRLYF